MATPITYGKNHNFFQKVTVTNAAFPVNADVAFAFRGPVSFTLQLETASAVVEYSLNGVTLDGDLSYGASAPLASASLSFVNRPATYIWFRVKSGSNPVIRVEAWGI